MRGIATAAVLSALAGCIPERQPIYAIRRSALVPHPAPPMRTGFPIAGPVRVSLHDTTVLVPVEPVETQGANAGLYVARHNIGGALRVRVSEGWDLGVSFEASPLRGSMAVAEDAARPPGGPAVGVGATVAYSARVTPELRLGFDFALGAMTTSFREEARCVHNCTGHALYYEESSTHTVATGSASLIPSYRFGDTTLFAVVTRRNHPTNVKAESQTEWAGQYDDDDELDGGPGYTLLGVGAEVEATPGLRIFACFFRPLSTAVVTYGPAFGLGVAYEPSGPRRGAP